MAHETLKTLITQNIKTNGRNAITAQILQDVLIAMVDDYPDISGYATRTWVQQQDYAPKEWVWESLAGDTNEQIAVSHLTTALSAYATITQLGDYLRLTGGTITGNLNISSNGNGYAQMFVDEDGFNIMVGALTNRQIYTGKIYSDSTITSIGFIKDGGTSAQFLKADGSVDSNTYITASALTDYATKSWVNTQLDGYLSLTGGTMQGVLFFSDEEGQEVRGEIFGDEYGLSIQVAGSGKLFIENAIEADSTIKTEGFIKRGGTADQVLCADGSVKTMSELKTALNAI